MKTNLIQTCLLTVLLALPAAVQAQFTYTTTNGAIKITSYTGSGGAVTITNISGTVQIIDAGAPGSDHRFYRAMSP